MPFKVSANDTEILDVELLIKGDRFSVIVGPGLRRTGWRGGQWVYYVPSAEGDFVVEASNGTKSAGFIIFQSENYELAPPYGTGPGSNANYQSLQMTVGVGGQNVVTIGVSSIQAFFKIYETRRLVGGLRTGAPIVYGLHNKIRISENGLLCNDSDVDLATVGILAPINVGIVSAVPAPRNYNRLGADIGCIL